MAAPRPDFRKAIVDAARCYTELLYGPDEEVLRIDVGYGEIDGSAFAPDALGESESYGCITNGATSALVVNALDQDTSRQRLRPRTR